MYTPYFVSNTQNTFSFEEDMLFDIHTNRKPIALIIHTNNRSCYLIIVIL